MLGEREGQGVVVEVGVFQDRALAGDECDKGILEDGELKLLGQIGKAVKGSGHRGRRLRSSKREVYMEAD